MRNKKDKIFIGLAIALIVVIIGVIVALMPNNKPNNNNIITIPEEEMKLAEYLMVSDEKGLNLVDLNGTVVDTISGKIQFVLNDKNDTFMYEKENTLYKAYITEKTENETTTLELVESKVYTSDVEIDKFAFNEKYIIVLTKTNTVPKAEEVKTTKPTLNSQITNNIDKTYYTLTVINKENLTKKEFKDLVIDEFTLIKDSFVYASDNMVYSLNLTTDETVNVYLGKDVTSLTTFNDRLIVFNAFGNAKDTSLILQMDENLVIQKASKPTSANVFAIKTTVDTENIAYIEFEKNPTLYLLNMDGDREEKQKSKLSLDGESLVFNENNTIYTSGYVYTAQIGKIFVIDLKTTKLHADLNMTVNSVYPILDKTSMIITETPSEEIILNTETIEDIESTEIESTETNE